VDASRFYFAFLDEAHQFLDKQLGDENTRYPLDAFDLIAKLFSRPQDLWGNLGTSKAQLSPYPRQRGPG
jgi:hypothetical protein